MRSVVVHYQEIALKGRNRPWFITRLVRNLRLALSDLDVVSVRPLIGRIEIVLGPGAPWPEIRERLGRLPGIANFSIATRVPAEIDVLAEGIIRDLADAPPRSFRIAARRSDKRFPIPSPDIERQLGARVQQAFGWPVQLDHPELVIRVQVLHDEAFYYFDRHRGPGGLPTGASGRVLCLLSGGIDSPVAAWRMMRRGCTVQFAHFHGQPYTSATSQQKVREIVALLAQRQLRARLHMVSFGDLQRQVVLAVPPALRVVVYRRLMLRIAEGIARSVSAKALVTGDVVGQVASQTIENLAVVEAASSMLLLRPLVGADKEEITAEAERIGTFATSVIPDEDCCTLFTPRHPVTRARLEEIEAAEAPLPITEMVRQAVAAAAVEEFVFPTVASHVIDTKITKDSNSTTDKTNTTQANESHQPTRK
jgi:thiamine biosynthesis protein ThiI